MIPPRLAVMVLTNATAVIHFGRALVDPEIRVLFILSGLGYLVLLALWLMPQPQHRLINRVLMGYTAVTIAFYFIWVAMSGEWNAPAGPVDKLIEMALLFLLWQEEQQQEATK